MKHKNFLKKLTAGILGFVMTLGVGAAGYAGAAGETKAAISTYQHVFNSKPSTGDNISLSGISWTVSATNLNGYNSQSYAGVQFGTSSKTGAFGLVSSSNFRYDNKTKIKEIRLWLNKGGGTVTPSAKIGSTSMTSSGSVSKNSSAGSDWSKTSKITFTPGKDSNNNVVDSGILTISISSTVAGYICCLEVDVDESTATKYTVSFEMNGHGTQVASQQVEEGSTADVPTTPTDANYKFAGWYEDNSLQQLFDFSTSITSNKTLYAKWTEKVDEYYVESAISSLSNGEHVIIVGSKDSTSYMMTNDNGTSGPPDAPTVTFTNNKIKNPEENVIWTFESSTNGFTFYKDDSKETWLYVTNTNNGVRVGTNSNNKYFTINNNYLKSTTLNRYIGVYLTNPDWRCYDNYTGNNIAGQSFKFYKYEVPVSSYSVTATCENCVSDGVSTCNTGEDYVANISPNEHYDLVSVSQVKSNNVSLTLDTDYTWSDNKLTINKSAIQGDITFTATGSKSSKTVSLSNDSEHVSLSGSTSVLYHNSLSTTINADSNYERPASVTATMGNSDFTNFNYTKETGLFSVDGDIITGNIVIKAVATAHVYDVDRSGLVNINYSEDTGSSHAYLGSFSATLTAAASYTLNGAEITVTMGGNTLTGAYKPSTHKVEIASVTGDIVIYGSAIEISGPEISLSKYESEFEYMSSDTIIITATNATVTEISASWVEGGDVAEFELYEDCETINITSIDFGLGYYNLTVYYQDNGGESGSKTFIDFGVQVNRHTALSFSLTNATSDQSSTTSYDYGTEFDITVTPNQYYTLEEGDITIIADGDDITDAVTIIDGDEALISLEDEYDSVSITVNATKIPAYVVSIAITTQATTKTFKVGATFDHGGIVITGTNNDGTSAGIVTSMCQFSAPDMLTAGEKTVTITYDNNPSIYTSYTITITETALLDGGLSSLTWKKDDEDMTLGKVYENIELAQTDVGNWALSSGEVYSYSGYNYVLGDYSTSNGAWSSFSQMENFKSVANGLKELNLVNLRADGTTIYGRYGAIISKDFKISRLYKAEINWTGFVCSSGATIKNEIYILGSKNGGVSWEKLGEKTDVTIGTTSAGSLSWTNINKYSSNDKVLIAIAYVSNSEATSSSSPAIRNLKWKFYGDSLNKSEKWNAFDFTLNKEASTLKVGEEETLSVTPVPNFAQDSFTWTSSNEDVVTVENGVVNAVGEGSATITATSSQGVEKSCSYTIGPADIHVTGVSIKYNNVVVTSDSIQERSTRTYVADVQPADATDKSVTWSISEISPAGCASINSSTGEVTASAAGSAKITVTTTDGSKSASCDITITAYPSYNIVYKAGEGSGDDITDKVDFDEDTTARPANTFTAPNGKKFDHWLGSDTNTYNAGAAISKLSSGSTLTLTAVYVADTYTITYLDQCGNAYSGSTISSPTSYIYGVGATLPTVTKSGFSFGGWYAESACSGSPVTSISTSDYGNKTFYAKWTFNSQTNLDDIQKSIGMAYKYDYIENPVAQNYYEKVTTNLSDWSGTYLIVYEQTNQDKSITPYIFKGVDAGQNVVEGELDSQGHISTTLPTGAVTVTMAPMASGGGYSVKVNGGTNDGKYMSGASNSNTISFGTSAVKNDVTYNSLTSGRILQFNSASGNTNFRFRYYSSGSQQPLALYKLVNKAATHYENVDFRFNLKFNGLQTFAEENNVDSDYGLVVSYSGRTRYFSVKNKQVLEEGKDPVTLDYKGNADNGYFTIRLGDQGDVINELSLSQVKYKVQVYAQDSAGTKYVSNTFVEYSVQSLIEEYYNNPKYCTAAVQTLYEIFGPTTKGE